MGDRAQVLINNVYLYTHWGASELPEIVEEVISRRQRWDDPEYLARMIFSAMVRDEIGGETGYGIGTTPHGDIWRLVEVDCENQAITVYDYGKPSKPKTFSEIANKEK